MKIVALALIIISSTLTNTFAQGAKMKTASVDANILITKYYKADLKLSALTKEREKYISEREEQTKIVKDIESKIRTLIEKIRNPDTKAPKRKTLQLQYDDLVSQHRALIKDVQDSDRSKVTEIKGLLADETRLLLDEIHVAVTKYAKANGYKWVIETSGTSNTKISPLVYARETTDITNEVLAVLNKDAPKKDADADTSKATE